MIENKLLISSIAFAAMTCLTACADAPEGDKTTVAEEQQASNPTGQIFLVDTAASRIRFTGHGVGKNHPGTFRISSGKLAVANNQVTGGEFVINIESINLEQKEGPVQNKLRPHLLSGDFFDADKFKTARFVLTKVVPYEPNSNDTSLVDGANYSVSGNFTLKDVTKNITFPAKIDLDDDKVKAKANFDIDRTQWQMNYGNDKTLGDKFISEKVNIELDLEATKQ